MKTIAELVDELESQIERDLQELILTHSTFRRWNYPDSGIIYIGGDYKWEELDADGRTIQSKTLEEYRRFSAIVRTLTQAQPAKYLEALGESERSITEAIEQNTPTHYTNPSEAWEKTREALRTQKSVVANLYGQASETCLFVPDTNALVSNPDLEAWRFPGNPKFKLVLITTVLSELDSLKVNYRVESVRQKAESLIGRIKGYRGRGRLTEGVPLVQGISDIVALAVEPDLTKSLPWLDKENADDRIIAAFLEVMRVNPRSPVVLVTRDINLQNKAEFAHLPFCEPPPPGGAT